MVSATRYLLMLAAAPLFACQSPVVMSLPISKKDHTTQWWGNPSYGSRQHYVHVVRDERGRLKDVYRYYLDQQGKPVLDGPRGDLGTRVNAESSQDAADVVFHRAFADD